ncbi:hypothetical protein ASPZODRAFT_131811 [Penicilliopsis zonata CBS 506.65]|uniref:Uncharacterized protein n=1 Tax=Penicilliopsis zonata CBS 506.65 TaxID=1073090 RepID=A0A1L9SI69_9EURO|nr:hypothetical protein ASPZODRAFT_131811 [Penicilliopsis zonata CBS 506.65]OJJ46905.1 hypothetical protein ASPZODRAFT_131811 [Penicilliopsis zonata CBS 506.65]
MALHRLSPEILSLILESLNSPIDLYHLASASCACWRVFVSFRRLVLSSVLKNAIHLDALPHALAVINAPAAVPGSPTPKEKEVIVFLNKYRNGWRLVPFPTAWDDIVCLSRLYMRVTRLVDDYATHALQALRTIDRPKRDLSVWPTELASAVSLSQTERARFLRAFFRFELYCKLFPVAFRKESWSLFDKRAQFELFLARLQGWEIEELACVHQYLALLVDDLIKELEDQLVSTVLSCKLLSSELNSNQEDSELVSFNPLALRGMDLFSEERRLHLEQCINFLSSLGLDFIYNLLIADRGVRKQTILAHVGVRREFLPQALSSADNIELMKEPTWLFESSARCNLGWVEFRRFKFDRYPDSYGSPPLRAQGYVFWDERRIHSPGVAEKLDEAQAMDQFEAERIFDCKRRKRPREILAGVKIPRAEMERIEKEFVFTF